MPATRFDVIGIGNAIVDVIARTEDDFLIQQKMHKGGMQLIDGAQATRIYQAMGPAVEVSGGSAANTVVGVASLGASAAFIGKVSDASSRMTSARQESSLLPLRPRAVRRLGAAMSWSPPTVNAQ
jgi:sugar/nucleoside kinase (ribokinase family)